jgi:hypothetical protein
MQEIAMDYTGSIKRIKSCRPVSIKQRIITVFAIYIYETVLHNKQNFILPLSDGTHSHNTKVINMNKGEWHRERYIQIVSASHLK